MKVIRYHFTQLDSTNTWAKHNAHLLDPTQMTLITADEQTAGRGRFKRPWLSPAGQNLYATFCFFYDSYRSDLNNLPQVLSLSAAQLIQDLGFQAQLKWPNDVLVEGRKIAGILCETTPVAPLLCVALGIGLNVNMPLEILQHIDRPATSLLALDGLQRNIEDMLILLQNHFLKDLDVFNRESFAPFLTAYSNCLIHKKGDLIRCQDHPLFLEGTFERINSDGTMTLSLPNRDPHILVAGEIKT
jgi:BirA family biotin operon repressor/biotin-[acetyl-CoA-carboxylase] ligase